MACGNHPNLLDMLGECIPTYIDSFGFQAGIVFRLESSDETHCFRRVYSCPQAIETESIRAVRKAVPRALDETALRRYYAKLPLIGACGAATEFGIMSLDGFGLVAFVAAEGAFSRADDLAPLLLPLNDKLARSCLVCDNIHALKKEIEDIKAAEEEKERLEKLLQQSQKMEAIGSLAGGIAHDFNNLLTPILGLAQLCLDEPGDEEYMTENLQEIYDAGIRAKELVNQILTFSRRTEESLLPLKPKTIIRETLKLMRSSLPTTLDIRRNIVSEGTMLGIPTQIQQIVMNLCTNAAHAMKAEGGVMEVLLTDEDLDEEDVEMAPGRKPGPYIKLTVSDTGSGIPEEIQDAIFEPYFTTKEPNEGTGLGLALVHSIVDNYRGIIRFESRPGKGTRFEIFFPRQDRLEPRPSALVCDLPTGTESILLVDDELPIVKFGKKLLTRLGYSVTVRTSSIEALGLFRNASFRFDLVISDMTMANMTGDRLAAEMKRIRPDIPVIIFTGYSDQLGTKSALDIGVEALLYKPIIAGDIARAVRSILDNPGGNPGDR